ncbi:MAG: hypothetical protein IJW28_04020, partial [Clostridia bacterium]|nr:hypothetical protein [Clostridia bacterium]
MISSIINKLLSVVISGILKLIFNYIVSPIFTILTAIVTSIVSWYFYEITVFILTVVDFLFDIFQMLAGLKSGLVFAGLTNFFTGEVYAAGVIPETQDILMQLLTSKELLQVFASMLTVGLFLLIVFTLVKVVKVEFTTEGSQNAKGPIIRKMLRALFNMIFTPTICLFGVVLASMLLELVTTAFLGDSDDLTISGVIFTSGCYNATYSYGEMMVSLTDPVTSSITGGINAAITLINQGFESIGSDALIDASKFSVDKANYLINGQKLTDSEYKYYYKVIKGGTPPKSISSMTKDELKEAKLMVEKYKRDLLFDSYTYVTKHNDFIPYFGETQYKPTGSGKGIIYYGGSLSIDTPEGTKTFTEV